MTYLPEAPLRFSPTVTWGSWHYPETGECFWPFIDQTGAMPVGGKEALIQTSSHLTPGFPEQHAYACACDVPWRGSCTQNAFLSGVPCQNTPWSFFFCLVFFPHVCTQLINMFCRPHGTNLGPLQVTNKRWCNQWKSLQVRMALTCVVFDVCLSVGIRSAS